MKNLKLRQVEIIGVLDKDGECEMWSDGHTFLSKEEMQQVIDYLTELLKQ